MSSLENDVKITGYVVPQFEKETVVFDYNNEAEFEEFKELSKTHGVFIYHQRYEHKVDELLKGQPVFLPISSVHYQCNHSGKKKSKEEKDQPTTKKRRKTKKTSIKNGCSAKFQKTTMANGRIQVKYKWKHTNHDPTNIQEVVSSKLTPMVKSWIEKKVAEGLNWKDIKALSRADPSCLGLVSSFSFQHVLN